MRWRATVLHVGEVALGGPAKMLESAAIFGPAKSEQAESNENCKVYFKTLFEIDEISASVFSFLFDASGELRVAAMRRRERDRRMCRN